MALSIELEVVQTNQRGVRISEVLILQSLRHKITRITQMSNYTKIQEDLFSLIYLPW